MPPPRREVRRPIQPLRTLQSPSQLATLCASLFTRPCKRLLARRRASCGRGQGERDDRQCGRSPAQNGRLRGQNGPTLANGAALLQKFSSEWRRFWPQLPAHQSPGIMVWVRHIHLPCRQGLTFQLGRWPSPVHSQPLANSGLRIWARFFSAPRGINKV
jgi:hypothetical protein